MKVSLAAFACFLLLVMFGSLFGIIYGTSVSYNKFQLNDWSNNMHCDRCIENPKFPSDLGYECGCCGMDTAYCWFPGLPFSCRSSNMTILCLQRQKEMILKYSNIYYMDGWTLTFGILAVLSFQALIITCILSS